MTPPRVLVALLLFAAVTASAQSSDVAIALSAPERLPAGSDIPLALTVANIGTSFTTAFVRIPNLAARAPATPRDSRCHYSVSDMTCNVAVAAGDTVTLNVNLAAPDLAGRVTATAEALLYPVDFDLSNNNASASIELVDAVDLAAAIQVRPSLRPLGESSIQFLVNNLSAKTVSATGTITIPAPLEVRQVSPNCTSIGDATYRCDFATIFGRLTGGAGFTVFVPRRGDPVTLSATVGPADDFDPSNNTVERVEPIYDIARLTLSIDASDRLDETKTATICYGVTNESDFEAREIVLTLISGFATVHVVSASAPGCESDGKGSLTCAIGSVAPGEHREIVARVTYSVTEGVEQLIAGATQHFGPDVTGASTTLGIYNAFYRYFPVTNTADSGPGSLRDAILALNDQCRGGHDAPPCKIAFLIGGPPPAEGWFTIDLRSPLPAIVGGLVAVDGATQTALTGDGNPLGPEIFLDGRDIGAGDGLLIQSNNVVVRGLAIGGFTGNGILAMSTPDPALHEVLPVFEGNYLGTDPSGTRAVPNGLRGLMTSVLSSRIRGNVVSNNRRSGMYLLVWGGDVRDNRIEGNGASGIFLGYGTDMVVENNVIAGNGEFGVAIAVQGRAEIRGNTIARNGAGAYDVGLDGPTIGGAPQIDVAREEMGDTIIEGHVAAPFLFYRTTRTIYLFANREVDGQGFAEGEDFLGTAVADAAGHFSFRVPADLRGRWIDGTALVVTDFGDAIYKTSSEFGPPLRVAD
jgi:parallel beta-helix repeat protein